jgi:hypothetical protein
MFSIIVGYRRKAIGYEISAHAMDRGQRAIACHLCPVFFENLRQADILIEARILAVADVVESMASHRAYRPTAGINAALDEIVSI